MKRCVLAAALMIGAAAVQFSAEKVQDWVAAEIDTVFPLTRAA